MSKIPLVLSILALSACAEKSDTAVQPAAQPTEPQVQKYTVKIHRPFTAGQVIMVDIEAHQLTKALVQGAEQDVVGLTEELNIHLVGEATIDEVAPDGRAGMATFKVTKFVNPETQAEILPAGSVVKAKRVDGMLTAEIEGGKALTGDQLLLVDLAFPFERPGTRLGDELFGTPEPRAVGESWPFNRGYVAQDLQEDGIAAAETGIDGMVKLSEVVPCGKTQCLRLNIDMEATSASMAAVEGASDVGQGGLRSTIILELPVDETLPVHLEDATTTLTFGATFTQGDQKIDRQIAASRLRRARYEPK
jgi:hypothetical protein